MANADAAFGFKPVMRDGSPYNGATLRAVFAAGDATATFIGDAVKTAGTAIGGYPTVAQCAAGDPVLGVVVSFDASPTDLDAQYRKASTQRFCKIAPVDSTYFEVQSDDDTTALAITEVGLNADFIVAAGSTVTGMSKMELDSSSAATTATLDLQIVWFPDRPDNDITSANKVVIVKFNDPQSKAGRTGV
jgi:hypothetical protein